MCNLHTSLYKKKQNIAMNTFCYANDGLLIFYNIFLQYTKHYVSWIDKSLDLLIEKFYDSKDSARLVITNDFEDIFIYIFDKF